MDDSALSPKLAGFSGHVASVGLRVGRDAWSLAGPSLAHGPLGSVCLPEPGGSLRQLCMQLNSCLKMLQNLLFRIAAIVK